MCVAGPVVAFWSFTQEVTSLNLFYANILVTEFAEFNQSIQKKLKCLVTGTFGHH